MSDRSRHVAAALVYLALALWTMRSVLPSPADSYPVYASSPVSAVTDGDQSHMIWSAQRTARTLVTAPWRLWDYEFCWPFPHAVALGHHGYASALLAAVPYALTGEPVLAHNVVSLLMLWLSALGMYALAYYWTRSAPAAFVAGLLFAFQCNRLMTLRWPAIVGDEWTPPALLFTHRLFVRGRWRDAVALAFFIGMQVLESFYQLVPLALLGMVYGGWLAVRHRARLRALAPQIAFVMTIAAGLAAIVLLPYVEVQRTWGANAGHQNLFPPLSRFFRGQGHYPGTMLLALGLLGLLDRVRRRRGADDPRLPLLVGALLILTMIIGGVAVPGRGFVLSPGQWIVYWLPGLDTVRGLQFGVHGAWLVLSLLAAYGTLALIERRSAVTATAVALGLASLSLVETFVPSMAVASFGNEADQAARRLEIPRGLVRLFDRLPDGAVLDVPADDPPIGFPRRAHRVLLAAFHRRPFPTCFTSFPSPLGPDVEALGLRLADPRAADALWALGFRSVVVHEEDWGKNAPSIVATLDGMAAGNPRLTPLGESDGHRLYRLDSTTPVRNDMALLAAGVAAPPARTQRVDGPSAEVEVVFRNPGPETFRHPDPIVPTDCVARWYTVPGDRPAGEQAVRPVLPLALAANDTLTRRLTLDVPNVPGLYRVTLAPAATPDTVVAVGLVTVVPPAPPAS